MKIYIPLSREYDPESTVPLAGMQSKFTSPQVEILYLFQCTVPASGDAHKIFIPPSREYDLELTIPLAGMQSKYCIPASGASVTISRDAHENLHFPPRRNAIQPQQFRLRKCNQNIASPPADIL